MANSTDLFDRSTNGRRSTSTAPSILIVDSDPDTRDLYRQCFELAGCSVVESSDGRDALAKALSGEPSLVVTEIRVPFIDGLALCELLRRDPATKQVPIVIVTSDTRASQLAQARCVGADAVLIKPALPDEMLDASMKLLKRTSGERESSAETPPQGTGLKRNTYSKSHARFATVKPPAAPPALTCPSCDRSLNYDHSHIGGVNQRRTEQWDYYDCEACGTFQYRQRTRKLRRVS